MRLRRWVVATAAAVCAMAVTARADRAEEIARIHLDALGGQKRVGALAALRATGYVTSGGKRLRFVLIAARPAKVRLEIENGGRTLVQGTDGEEPPWEFDTGSWPARYHPMAQPAARVFAADAEFDDPLIAGPARGFVLEYGGEIEADGQKLLRILVTRKLVESFWIFVDAKTYLITRRVEERKSTGGRLLNIVTRYEDYRAIDGVLVPHDVTMVVDGRISQRTQISEMVTNPEVTAETFTRPRVSDAVKAEQGKQ